MNKTDLIDMVAEETGQTKKATENVVNTTIDTIMEYLGEEAQKKEQNRDNVQLIGFGTFETKDRASRKGRNPQTGEEITIPERTAPVFRAGKTFKDKVDK